MKKFLISCRERGRIIYLVLFLVMIIPALLSFYAAEGDHSALIFLFLGLVILANIAALLW